MADATTPITPDKWSLESWFSALGAPDYVEWKEHLQRELQERLASETMGPIADDLAHFEDYSARFGHLSAYLGCLSADDSANEVVKADEAWISALGADLTKWRSTLQSTLAGLPDNDFATLLNHEKLAGAQHAISRMRTEGRLQMTDALEALAADLNVDGIHAWGRLYQSLTGKMEFRMKFPDGQEKRSPWHNVEH